MIDPTDPAVVDVRDFRRAGESKTLQRVATAGEDLGNPVIAVPVGSDVSLDLLLESVVEGVLVNGTATFPVVGQCSRCLDPVTGQVSTSFSELFLWEEPEEVGEDDDPLPLVTEGLVDLRETVRDAIVLDLPLAPVCDEDCRGLCATCGARLADDPGHHHDTADPRWAALADLDLESADPPEEGMGNT